MPDNASPLDPITETALRAYFLKVYGNVPDIEFINVLPANTTAWRAVCYHGSAELALATPEVTIPGNNVLDLNHPVRITALSSGLEQDVLVGQCQECGRVHWGLLAPQAVRGRG